MVPGVPSKCPSPLRPRKQWIVLAGLVAVTAAADSGRRSQYTPRDKAFFLDDPTVQFVRPGLAIKVHSGAIASDGTISVTVGLADPQGLPLDRAGVTTPGAVSLSFIAAYIPPGQEQYIS